MRNAQYPNDVRVGPNGMVYVLEAAGCSTSFGGNKALQRINNDGSVEMVLNNLSAPVSFVFLNGWFVVIGMMGLSSPGNTGSLEMYNFMTNEHLGMAFGNLPAVESMLLDPNSGDLYVAGYSDYHGMGVIFLPNFRQYAIEKTFDKIRGYRVNEDEINCNGITMDNEGNVYYSSARGPQHLYQLKKNF